MTGCKSGDNATLEEDRVWRLGWRMVENFLKEEHDIAEMQFDSLLATGATLEYKFLVTGLKAKAQLSRNDEVAQILGKQSLEKIQQICQESFAREFKICANISPEKAENKALQQELVKMFVDDQAARGNLMTDLIEKYGLDSTEVTTARNGVFVDSQNRERLKEIIAEYGFPNRKLVGKDAMAGVFFIIQHADGDKEWQKSQLPNVEIAVKNGDMDGRRYAYLFDRIQVHSGNKQRYGTQFENVDLAKGIAELAETEAPESLDTRRREIGLMPISMYKKYMLSPF